MHLLEGVLASLFLLEAALMTVGSYFISTEKKDFYSALQDCDKLGEDWKLLNGQPKEDHLTALMSDRGINTVWIAVKRKETYWQWTDQSPYDGFNGEASNHQCALLTFNGHVVSSTCIAQQAGFACQLMDELSCPAEYLCLEMNGTKLFIDCSSNDWFASQYRCRQYKGNLVHLKDPTMTNEVVNFMEHSTKCQQVFIGLYKEKWLHVELHTDGNAILQTHWDTGQPAYAFTKNCVEMTISSGKQVWRTQSCSHRNHFICTDGIAVNPTEKAGNGYKPTKNTSTEQGETKKNQEETHYHLMYLVLLIPLAAVCGVLICMFRYMHPRILVKLNIYKENKKADRRPSENPPPLSKKPQEEEECVLLSSQNRDSDNDGPTPLVEVNVDTHSASSVEVHINVATKPIKLLLLSTGVDSEVVKIHAQLKPYLTDEICDTDKESYRGSMEAKLLVEKLNEIKIDINDVDIYYTAIFDTNHSTKWDKLEEILPAAIDNYHILYFSYGLDNPPAHSNVRELFRKAARKCIVLTSAEYADSETETDKFLLNDIISVRNSSKAGIFTKSSNINFEVTSSEDSSPWIGGIWTTALIVNILLTIFNQAEELSDSAVAKAQTTRNICDIITKVCSSASANDGVPIIKPGMALDPHIIADQIRHCANA